MGLNGCVTLLFVTSLHCCCTSIRLLSLHSFFVSLIQPSYRLQQTPLFHSLTVHSITYCYNIPFIAVPFISLQSLSFGSYIAVLMALLSPLHFHLLQSITFSYLHSISLSYVSLSWFINCLCYTLIRHHYLHSIKRFANSITLNGLNCCKRIDFIL